MSNLRKIGNKLFKESTELKSQEVELGLIDDYNSIIDKANSFRKVAAGAYNKVETNMRSAHNQMELAVKEAEKIQQAAEDLGVKSPVNLGAVKNKEKEFGKVVNFLKSGEVR